MKFERTEEYEAKLFSQALFDDKKVIKDATVRIVWGTGNKLKAYCVETDTYIQFPRDLRKNEAKFTADVVEVQNESVSTKYYRVMKGSIRKFGTDEVVA